jgi:vacuolar-type H+-ATPase subunit H
MSETGPAPPTTTGAGTILRQVKEAETSGERDLAAVRRESEAEIARQRRESEARLAEARSAAAVQREAALAEAKRTAGAEAELLLASARSEATAIDGGRSALAEVPTPELLKVLLAGIAGA